MEVEAGERVRFAFGGKKQMKEGTVEKVFPKAVYLKVDFDGKTKTVRRKKHELHPA